MTVLKLKQEVYVLCLLGRKVKNALISPQVALPLEDKQAKGELNREEGKKGLWTTVAFTVLSFGLPPVEHVDIVLFEISFT